MEDDDEIDAMLSQVPDGLPNPQTPNLTLSTGGRSVKLTYPLCVVHIPPPPPCYHVTINLLRSVLFAIETPVLFLVMTTDPDYRSHYPRNLCNQVGGE
jgi:hypothetical protein